VLQTATAGIQTDETFLQEKGKKEKGNTTRVPERLYVHQLYEMGKEKEVTEHALLTSQIELEDMREFNDECEAANKNLIRKLQ
jgi:bifunctional N-acetylglucosamine-1-phosphate-uridyltransferase/glucosamine-1-phosphate-acetyltransferase GlmU-like protein